MVAAAYSWVHSTRFPLPYELLKFVLAPEIAYDLENLNSSNKIENQNETS